MTKKECVNVTTLKTNCFEIFLKSLFNSQYRKGFQKLLLKASQVIRKSKNGGTFEFVQAATTS